MNTRSPIRALFLLSLAALITAASPESASAQQVTYYTFDDAPSSYSNSCSNSPSASNPLLCLNNGTGDGGGVPAFVTANQSSLIGEKCGPNDARCPYSDNAYHTFLQLTSGLGSQGSSVWFSIPQRVTNGFTSYFAFRITRASGATADGLTFLVQNSTSPTPSVAHGSGPTVIGEFGGGIGYQGIDNSLAVELDTFYNSEFGDPSYTSDFSFDSNHIAVQSCGTAANSASHLEGGCLVGSGITSSLPFQMADGRIHEVVVEYTGPATGTTPNYFVYLDPPFLTGTHTPDPSTASPTVSVHYDFSLLSLLGPNGDSAYVGFTSSTGFNTENGNLLAWTFTPHTPVTAQPETINDGSPTVFNFGAHTYAATYPAGTSGGGSTDMITIASTVPQTPDFDALVAGTPYAGSQCQVYEGTGGNCIIYSVYCVSHGTTDKVACPSTTAPVIGVKTAYESNNDTPPPSPGFLHGDPFYSPITGIQGNGATATVSCTGSCSVSDGQTVSIRGNSVGGLNAENVVASAPTIDTFTYPLAAPNSSSGTGGFVTSHNFTDICDVGEVTPDNPPCWQPAKIDGTTSGKTKNFSELAALSITVFTPPAVGTATAITSVPAITYGQAASVTVSVSATSGSATPTGSVSLTVGGNSVGTQVLSSGSATYSVPNLNANPGGYVLFATYVPDSGFQSSTGTGTLVVNKATPTVNVTGGTYVYDGNPHPAAGSVTGVGGANLGTPAFAYTPGGATPPKAAGSYAVLASFAGNTNYNPATANATITITQPAAITVTSSTLNFGDVVLGSKKDINVTVKNVSNATVNITKIYFNYGSGGSSTNYGYFTQCGGNLKAGKTCTIQVELKAQDLGPGSSKLFVAYNASGSPVLISLSGNVINPKAKLSVSSLSFGTQKVNTSVTKTVILTSTGDTPLLVSGVALSGSTDFTSSGSCPASLPKNASCTISVTFRPTAKTSRTGTLKFTDNASSSPQSVSLSGKGN